MATGAAIASLEWLYEKAVRDNSVPDGDFRCEVTALPEAASLKVASRDSLRLLPPVHVHTACWAPVADTFL